MQSGESCSAGSELFRARRFAEAQGPLWHCVSAGAPAKEAAYQLALTYRELKNYDDGWRQAEAAQAGRAPSEDLLYVSGYLKFRMGAQQESIRLLEQAYRLDNYDWRVHQAFALNYIRLDILPGALHELRTAVALNPREPELHYELARLYYTGQMQIADSIAETKKALALSPEYTEAVSNLALCYEALAQNDQAREHFERAIALTRRHGSRDEWPYINYAAFLIKQGDPAAGLPLLEEALARNADSAKAHYFLGRALRKLNRDAEARPHLETAIRLDALDAPAYYELGMLLAKDGDRTRSRHLLDRFQELTERQRPKPARAGEVR